MAKKKKKSSKKAAPAKDVAKSSGKGLPEHFWRQASGIGLIIAAVMLLFGSFGAGGSLP